MQRLQRNVKQNVRLGSVDMKLSECVSIFWDAYVSKEPEWSLHDAERFSFLEARYPRGIEEFGKILLLTDRVINRISELSQGETHLENSLTRHQIAKLYDQAFLENKLLNKWDGRFVTILGVLKTVITSSFQIKADNESVYTLASYAMDYWMANGNSASLPNYDNRLNQIVGAAHRLKRYMKHPVSIEDGSIVLGDSIVRSLHTELDKRIAYAGGIPVLQRLFKEKLTPRFSNEIGRYLIHREARNYYGGTGAARPEIPFGYLFQIAAKHIFYPVVDIRIRRGEGYDEIIKMAQDIMLLADVWSDSPMAHLFIKVKDLPEYVVKNAAFDTLCIPMQYNADFCLEILNMYKPEQERLIPELAGIKPVAAWCLNLPPCAIFSVEDVHQSTNLSKSKIQAILDEFSIPWQKVNEQYVKPFAPTNQWGYPLIKGPHSNQYFQLCPQFSGYSFCDRLYTLLQAKEKTVGKKLGRNLENFVKKLLDKKQIPYLEGFYRDKKVVRGECDLILEGEKKILFVEIKKCPLGDGFRQVDDIAIFHDLADGMLAGQIQAYRHRARLEMHDCLKLYKKDNDPNPYYTLNLQSKSVHTMSLCLPEYAFFTQSFQANNFLEALFVSSFGTFDPEQSRKLDKLNKQAEQLRDIMKPIYKPEDGLKKCFHFSYFRSLQQFWISTQLASDLEQLIDYLTSDGSIVFNSMDFYVGLLQWTKRMGNT